MAKNFTFNKPAINATVVGFGQAGGRIADEFAKFIDENRNKIYNCLALNSNDGDMKGLKRIPLESRISLKLNGFGKNPQKAYKILEENKEVNEILKTFIREHVRIEDNLVLFIAGLGGGTGTATLVKSIEEFYDYYTKPLIKEELMKLQKNTPPEVFRQNLKSFTNKAVKLASEKSPKIGVIVTLPLRADGADVLRQVNDFSQRIWKLANDPSKNVAFVMFADNQHFFDEFNKLPQNKRLDTNNYRDYANKVIADLFHEINTAPMGAGADVTFDAEDFRRIILEKQGTLVINKLSNPDTSIQNSSDVEKMILESLETGSLLHQPIELVNENGELAEIHHVGLLTIIDERNKNLGSAYLDDARVKIMESPNFYCTGSIFTGYLEAKNDHEVSVYTFYKTKGLPSRLAKGLVEEYEEYQQRKFSVKTSQTSIATIEDDGSEMDFDIDLEELGLDADFIIESNDNSENKKKEDQEIDIDALIDSLGENN